MAGRRSSRDFPGLRSCSGEKHVGSSKVDQGAEKVVVIDLDDDDEVIIDDIKSSKPQSRCSSTLRQKKVETSTVIDIDDDDDDDDSTETDTVISVENLGDLDSDATSSKSRIPTSNYRQNSVSSDRDECEVVQEKCNPSKGPKGKQTYSGKAPSRNRFGLYSESEYESGDSDTDQSDCELMEGSSGELHEHWKKASEKRKHVIHQASGSGSHGHSHVDLDAETSTEQHADAPVCSSSDHGNYDKEFPDMGTCGDHSKGTSFETKMKSFSAKSNHNIPNKNSPCAVPGSAKEAENLHRNDDFQHVENVKNPFKAECFHKDGISGFSNEEQSPENHSVRSMDELGGKQSKHFMPNKQNFRDGTCFTGSPKSSLKIDQKSAEVSNEEFACKNQYSADMLSTHDSVEAGAKDDESNYAQSNRSASFPNVHQQGVIFKEKVKPVPEQSFDGLHVDSGIAPSDDDLRAVLKESTVYDDNSEISNEDVSEEKVGTDSPNLSCNNTGTNQRGFVSKSGNESFDATNQLLAQDGSATFVKNDAVDVQNNIITDREKLKDTAEYKQAMEEEMESRRRVLQIQAEESQRLRKRKKAESLRLLDMQRRQKQRVEEVRETQKKDEENLNMKDKLRAEIRKELNRLELSCRSMTSLLRGLGIQVGASIRPSPQEVQAAYKRALLKFHPDRASRTDIRQLVEAEEKFKLISRMKEKLISTTWF